MKINRRHFLLPLLCVPLALSVSSLPAESTPQWEKQWYPVKDGQEDKLFIRFGEDKGLRYRQWGNGYDVKVKFKVMYLFKTQGDAIAMTQEVVTLEPKGMTDENKSYPVVGNLVDIKVSYE